jgi:hypothetical protein
MNVLHRLGLGVCALLVCLSTVTGTAPSRVIALEGDRRPNLQMARIKDWHIQTVNGRRLLRFTTVFVNVGRGPFELRGHRASTTDPTMSINQIMYRADGTTRTIPTDAEARYAGDGHDHWHVQNVVMYEAWRIEDPLSTRRGAKIGFCFFDTSKSRPGTPGARNSRYYQEEWCGTRSVLKNRVGLSVGWGDVYPWNFVLQWIDITGLPGGRYHVRATVDLRNDYDEVVEDDNCTWGTIDIPDAGDGNAVTVESLGFGCDENAMQPVTTFPDARTFDPPAEVVFKPGPHVGYRLNSRGTDLGSIWRNPDSPRSGTTAVRARVPGRAGRWIYVDSGPYRGYWFRDTADIDVLP